MRTATIGEIRPFNLTSNVLFIMPLLFMRAVSKIVISKHCVYYFFAINPKTKKIN